MNPESTTSVLQAMVDADELDKNLVDLVFKHYETMIIHILTGNNAKNE